MHSPTTRFPRLRIGIVPRSAPVFIFPICHCSRRSIFASKVSTPTCQRAAAFSHGFFYSNDRYLNGYTSDGQLLGSWIGREGQGAQAWANYWFNARNRLQFNFRHQKVSQQFIPGGGTLTDVGVRNDYWLRPSLGISAWAQYERWLFPVIQPNSARNVTVGVEIQFQPQKLFQRSATTNAAADTNGIGTRR